MVLNKERKFHYGWVVAFCCTLMICSASLISTGMSTNLNAMRQHLGFTNTQTALVLTIRSITAFLAALCANTYYKMGLKRGMVIALLLGAATFALFAAAGRNLTVIYAGAVLSGICYAYGMMMPASMLLRNWFNKSRGTALSIASAGTGLVSVIFAPLVQSTVNRTGIKAAFILQGVFMVFSALMLALLVVEKPEEKGLEPYGGKDWVPEAGKGPKAREATELPYVWMAVLIGAAALVGAGASPCSANYTNNMVTAGLDAMTVAKGLSIYGAILIAAKLVYGVAIDKLGTLKTTLIFGFMTAAAIFMMFLINYFPNDLFMYVTFIITAVAVPVQTMGYPNWVVDLDSAHYNKTLVKCQTGYQLGAVVGSFIPGPIADATGSYALAYLIFFFCNLIPIILVFFCYRAGAGKRK